MEGGSNIIDQEQDGTKAATTTTQTLYYLSGKNEKLPHNTVYLRIYGHPFCTDSQKVWMTFKAKRIPFQKVVVDCENIAKWHADQFEGRLPILENTDKTMI